ncbi:MAG: hypothetical protein ACOCSE_00980 [Chitinivibrionales bacterium]
MSDKSGERVSGSEHPEHSPEYNRERLEEAAGEISKNYGVECSLCRVISRRWAHYAGSETPVFPEERIRINQDWGVILGGGGLIESDKAYVRDYLKGVLGSIS